MPIYEYRCAQCGSTFELLQNLNEGHGAVRCPKCRGNKAERIFSIFSSTSTGSSGANCGPGTLT